MKKLKTLGAYIGLFFLLAAPIIAGIALSLATGETYYYTMAAATRSRPGNPILSHYMIYGILAEVPWLAVALFAVIPSQKELARC